MYIIYRELSIRYFRISSAAYQATKLERLLCGGFYLGLIDAEVRKCRYQIGFGTLVVYTVNNGYYLSAFELMKNLLAEQLTR